MTYNLKRGDSFSIWFILPAEYDMARLKNTKVTIGNLDIVPQIVDHAIEVFLTSAQTYELFGNVQIAIAIDDELFGVKTLSDNFLNAGTTKSAYTSDSINGGANVVINLKFTEDIIEVDDIMYNYLRCQSPYEIAVENGYTGTEAEFNEQLGSFENLYNETIEAKNDAELAATNAEQSAVEAEKAKEYLENQLFHYISDDDISVRVGIGTQVLVSESTTGYPSLIIQLDTL
jgi:hypothetical protein